MEHIKISDLICSDVANISLDVDENATKIYTQGIKSLCLIIVSMNKP